MKSCFVFLVLLFNYIHCSTFRCDYKFMSSVNGWLKYHVIPANWHEARLRCTLEGAVLASPTSSDLSMLMVGVVKNVTPNVRQIFTGLHATFSRGEFYTVDGKPLSECSYKWERNQPNNFKDDESCLSLNAAGELSDVSCGEPRPYMCFRSNVPEFHINECGTIDPAYKLDSRTGKCYKFHVVARNFSRAHFACSAEGGHLAIINTVKESDVLKELYGKHPAHTMVGTFWKDSAFIGFHDWGENYDWRTIEGQTLQEAGFSKFSGGQPDNAAPGESCGAIFRNGLLNDLWCYKFHPFICEKDPNIPKICSEVSNTESP